MVRVLVWRGVVVRLAGCNGGRDDTGGHLWRAVHIAGGGLAGV